MLSMRCSLFLLSLFTNIVEANLSILLVHSSSTPTDLLSLLNPQSNNSTYSVKYSYRVIQAVISDFTQVSSLVQQVVGVVDVTFSSLGRETLAGLCNTNEVPHIVLGLVTEPQPHKWTFYVSGREKEIGDALDIIVAHFSWTRVNLLSDESQQLSSLQLLLSSKYPRVYQPLQFTLRDFYSVEQTVGRNLRMTGNRISVLVTSADMTKAIVTAQYNKNIGGRGFGNLIPLVSSLYTLNSSVPSLETGNLVLAEEELASVETSQDYYQALLSLAYSLFDNCSDPQSALLSIQAKYPTHFRARPFVLLNFQNGTRVPVGFVRNSQLHQTATISFLGDTPDVPQNGKFALRISGNFGVRNVGGISTIAPTYYRGALLAVDKVNSWPSILDNFNLEMFNFTAGVSVWDYHFAWVNVSPVRDSLGLAVVSGLSSGVTVKLMELLRDLNFSGPVIGASNTVDALSSREKFPLFIRTVLADNYITGVFVQLFKRFRWTKCGLLVSNESWGLGFQSVFSSLAKENGVEILNDPALQVLPTPIPSLDFLRNYSRNFLDFIQTKARILVLVVNSNVFYVIDYLYELGLRAGDVEIVCNEGMSITLFNTNDTEVNRRRSEIVRGSIQFAPVSYVGKFGNAVYREYEAAYNLQPPVYACFYYDSVLALAYALDIIIRGGDDYTNPTLLLKSLRGSRFIGCTGTVTFDPDSNDRSPMQYYVLNAQFGPNDSVITNITAVAMFDPTSTIVFRFYSDIVWCDGTTKAPMDVRMSTVGCPFEDKFNQEFAAGWNVLYLIYGLAEAGGVVLGVVIARAWRMRTLEVITERKEIQVQDVVLMLGVAIQLVQYMSLGPELTYFPTRLQALIQATTLDLHAYVDYKDGGFGLIWLGVVATVLLWVIMCIIALGQLADKLGSIPGCGVLGDISEFFVPIICDFFSLPILSVLLEVFVCVSGVGLSRSSLSFSDSYLSADCFQTCWAGVHLTYAITTAFAVVIFIPGKMVLKPMWQELTDQINIKASVLYLMVKSVLQITLVCLSKTVKVRYKSEFPTVFLVLMLTFVGFTLKFRCFGYKRTALWHGLGLLAVCWAVLLEIIKESLHAAEDVWFVGTAVAGWGFICLGGAIYQLFRAPSYLYRKPGVDTTSLFKFAFKPATSEILLSLRDSFQQVGNRNKIRILHSVPAASESPYMISSQDTITQKMFSGSRVHQTIVLPSEPE